jgi:phosphoglycerate dehydrogenase-like enzyme
MVPAFDMSKIGEGGWPASAAVVVAPHQKAVIGAIGRPTTNRPEDPPLHRCAILDDYQNVALSLGDWASLARQVEVKVFNEHLPKEKRVEALRDFDIVVAMRERTPFDAALIKALPNLKLLVTTGPRNASIDVAACEAQGITLCGTGSIAGTTVELAWALILGLARNLPAEAADFKAGAKWQPRISLDLSSRRLGVIGFGRLGARVARVGAAFGMDVVAWTPNLTDERVKAEGVGRAGSLDELLKTSDFVSIHVVLNASTRGMIKARELALMKPTAFLVNTSRGPVVDEAALIDALEEKRLAGAGLDVFDVEPLPADHPFRRLDNLIATPHIGYVTDGTYRVFFREIVEDISAWLKGAPVRVIASKK